MPPAFINQFAQRNAIEMAAVAELPQFADGLQMVALCWIVNRDELRDGLALTGNRHGLTALDSFEHFGQRTGRLNCCDKRLLTSSLVER
jgi:hypothetical protein